MIIHLSLIHSTYLFSANSGAAGNSRGAIVMWNRLLALAVQIFGWEFVKSRPKGAKRRMTNAETSSIISFRPPNSWRQLLFASSMIPFLFKIHRRVRHNSELSHHLFQVMRKSWTVNLKVNLLPSNFSHRSLLSQCLTQLASLGAHSPIFSDDDKKIHYLQSFVEGILGIMQTR